MQVKRGNFDYKIGERQGLMCPANTVMHKFEATAAESEEQDQSVLASRVKERSSNSGEPQRAKSERVQAAGVRTKHNSDTEMEIMTELQGASSVMSDAVVKMVLHFMASDTSQRSRMWSSK